MSEVELRHILNEIAIENQKEIKKIEEENLELKEKIAVFETFTNEINKKNTYLNNIIKELEKYLNDRLEFTNYGFIIDKLNELKEK